MCDRNLCHHADSNRAGAAPRPGLAAGFVAPALYRLLSRPDQLRVRARLDGVAVEVAPVLLDGDPQQHVPLGGPRNLGRATTDELWWGHVRVRQLESPLPSGLGIEGHQKEKCGEGEDDSERLHGSLLSRMTSRRPGLSI
jgi:hypothetical protein